MWEFPIFVLVGICGGLMGALFIHLNVKITHWRRKYIPVDKRSRRFYEVVAIAIATSIILFTFACASPCRCVLYTETFPKAISPNEVRRPGKNQ